MRVTVNGEARDVPEGSSLEGLLNALGIHSEAVVAERNGVLVERARFGDVLLEPGDRLELVRFVGGG